MIEIRGYFTPWHEVSEEKAIDYGARRVQSIMTMGGDDNKKLEYVNRKLLRGFTLTLEHLKAFREVQARELRKREFGEEW